MFATYRSSLLVKFSRKSFFKIFTKKFQGGPVVRVCANWGKFPAHLAHTGHQPQPGRWFFSNVFFILEFLLILRSWWFFLALYFQSKSFCDLIPTSPLLQLEAGINFETFIASTSGLKPFSSTDTNSRKTAIMTKLTDFHFLSKVKMKNPQSLPLRASIAPELLLLTCCPLGLATTEQGDLH